MRQFVYLLIAFYSLAAVAGDRQEKIQAIMSGQGQRAAFEYWIQGCKENSRRYSEQLIGQSLAGFNPPSEDRAKIKAATDAFLAAVEPPWSPDEYVRVWADYYGTQFTDEELDQLVAFYTSPVAQKETAVQSKTTVYFETHFQQSFKPIWEAAINAYGNRMKEIMKECKCAK